MKKLAKMFTGIFEVHTQSIIIYAAIELVINERSTLYLERIQETRLI